MFLHWNTAKNLPYPLAKYQPLFFKHQLLEHDFYIFQTLEMLDFKKALSHENIDVLVKEKGVFLAHTYFSVPLSYHNGKLFDTPVSIDPEVVQNLKALGQKIKEKSLWNPTLQEWVEYWRATEKIELDVTANGEIYVLQPTNIKYRKII